MIDNCKEDSSVTNDHSFGSNPLSQHSKYVFVTPLALKKINEWTSEMIHHCKYQLTGLVERLTEIKIELF